MTTPADTTIALRRATEDDVDAIVDLAQLAYRGEGGWTTEAHLVSGSRTNADEVRGMLAEPAVALLVAELGSAEPEGSGAGLTGAPDAESGSGSGTSSDAESGSRSGSRSSSGSSTVASTGPLATSVVGCCYTKREPADEHGSPRAELGLFAVHPGIQSRGLGSRLLESQADLLREAGVDVLMIRVLQSRPELHAWYERHGFVRTGTSVPFAGDPDWLQVEGLGMDIMERPLQNP